MMADIDESIVPICKRFDKSPADPNPEVERVVYIKDENQKNTSTRINDLQRVMFLSIIYSKIRNKSIQKYLEQTVKGNSKLAPMTTNQTVFKDITNQLIAITPREFITNYIQIPTPVRKQLFDRIDKAIYDINEPKFLESKCIQSICAHFNISLHFYTSREELLEFDRGTPIDTANIYAKYDSGDGKGFYGVPVSNDDLEAQECKPSPDDNVEEMKDVPTSHIKTKFQDLCDQKMHTFRHGAAVLYTNSYCIQERKFICDDCEDRHPKITKGQIIDWNKRYYEWDKKKELQAQIDRNVKTLREQKFLLIKQIDAKYQEAEECLKKQQIFSLDEKQKLQSEMTAKGISSDAFNDIFGIDSTDTNILHQEFDKQILKAKTLQSDYYQKIKDSEGLTPIVEKANNLFMVQ
jgi:hypothetical protein